MDSLPPEAQSIRAVNGPDSGDTTVNAVSWKRPRWAFRLGVVALLVVILVVAVWLLRRPKLVSVVNPVEASMTETIASSARVGGMHEAAIGAQFAGTVEKLFVKEGDRVKAGQPLAVLKSDLRQQRKLQAERAVQTARSQLMQASRRPSKSELAEAEHQVAEARAQAAQARAELALAQKNLARAKQMEAEGILSRADSEAAQAKAASTRALARSAAAAVKVREARLQILKETPKAEEVQVARDRLAEAQQALLVSQQEIQDATVTAPFTGVVTRVNAEQGQTVGATGVVDLVSDSLEMRVDLDENNLAELAVGLPAIISSSTFGGKTFKGRVSEIAAAVNPERGTIQVKIIPDNPPDWLRPGQTVNVNLITNERVDRLIVPVSSVLKKGDRTIVLVVQDGRVLEKLVLTRPATSKGVPIAAGLTTADRVIDNPSGIAAGDAVRVRR
jgi:HlyD family secretion protein